MRRYTSILLAAVFALALCENIADARVSSHRERSSHAKYGAVRYSKKWKAASSARPGVKCRVVCTRVRPYRAKRIVGAGPKMPAPVINVQPAEVKCPDMSCPTPQVNCPPVSMQAPGITVDNCWIYVIRNNELLLIDKNTLCVSKKITLNPEISALPESSP